MIGFVPACFRLASNPRFAAIGRGRRRPIGILLLCVSSSSPVHARCCSTHSGRPCSSVSCFLSTPGSAWSERAASPSCSVSRLRETCSRKSPCSNPAPRCPEVVVASQRRPAIIHLIRAMGMFDGAARTIYHDVQDARRERDVALGRSEIIMLAAKPVRALVAGLDSWGASRVAGPRSQQESGDHLCRDIDVQPGARTRRRRDRELEILCERGLKALSAARRGARLIPSLGRGIRASRRNRHGAVSSSTMSASGSAAPTTFC